LNKTEDTEKIKSQLIALAAAHHNDLEIKSWSQINEYYAQTKKLFNRFFLIIKIIIVIIVILGIFNTMNMAVFERISEIGTIMAMGTKRGGVLSLFVYEGLFLGIIGGALGVALGVAVTLAIASIGIVMPPPPGATMFWLSEPKIIPAMLMFAFAVAVGTSVISSLYPAWRASRLEIAEALRHK
jgi:putative ABC transport system permease protein